MKAFVVYKITNIDNGLFYIGSTSNFYFRKAEHLGQLRSGKHCNKSMQWDFNAFKEKAFTFDIVKDGFRSRQEMLLYEYSLIVKTFKQNYNIDFICPILDVHSGGVNHKQFKKKFNPPSLNKKANAKLLKQKQQSR